MAQIPADFADWLDFVAIGALLAFSWQSEPMVFAVLAVAMGLPYLVIGPFSGALVDRMDIRRVMMLSNLGRGLVTALMFLSPNWPILMILIALRSVIDTFFTPAKQAAIQALTEPSIRTSANGLSHAINQSSKIVAPAIGGALLIWVAPPGVFLMNAGVSVLAALLVLRLDPFAKPAAKHQDDAGLFTDVVDGFQDVRGAPVLRLSLIMMAAGFFAMFIYDTLIAPMTRDLGYSQTDLGFSLAAVGAGGVVASLALSFIDDLRQPFLFIAIGSLLSALAIAGLGAVEVTGYPLPVAAYFATFAILGVMSAVTLVPFRTIIQNNVAGEKIGRITALSEALNTVALLIAPFVGASVAAASSIGMAFLLGGAVMLCVAALAFYHRSYR